MFDVIANKETMNLVGDIASELIKREVVKRSYNKAAKHMCTDIDLLAKLDLRKKYLLLDFKYRSYPKKHYNDANSN